MMVGEYRAGCSLWSHALRMRMLARLYWINSRLTTDGNPNHSKACRKTANVSWNGKTIKVGIVNHCYARGNNHIDLAPSAFQQFSGLGAGKLYGVS
ncbi:unnamed protein product [Rhizoctonia solani]|uniref:Uncharacterized protein n=1 Tax=Rhizoctonia solani TaxID=456999 RepID=A0A8H3DBE7_9AGAM|nr:unnamed protein product [Rhizoctonia solani]